MNSYQCMSETGTHLFALYFGTESNRAAQISPLMQCNYVLLYITIVFLQIIACICI